jgi:hypothetical protein
MEMILLNYRKRPPLWKLPYKHENLNLGRIEINPNKTISIFEIGSNNGNLFKSKRYSYILSVDAVQPNPQIAITPLTLCSSPRVTPLQTTARPMHARHVFVFSVFLFVALCIVALLPPRNSPSPRLFFQSWQPPVTGNGSTDCDSGCDYSDGRWVRDDSVVPTAYTEDCPFLDPGFRCTQNGRSDSSFQHWRWQPHRCHLPR